MVLNLAKIIMKQGVLHSFIVITKPNETEAESFSHCVVYLIGYYINHCTSQLHK